MGTGRRQTPGPQKNGGIEWASNPNYCDVTPEIEALAALALENSCIDPEDYVRYDVKRGLRDLNGKACWPD